MKWLEKLLSSKNPRSKRYRATMAAELHGQAIRYVTERNGDTDEIVGRGGAISVRDGELFLFSSEEILLRARVEDLEAGYLLSGDGVVLTAPNIEEKGKKRSLVAYFVYYRK